MLEGTVRSELEQAAGKPGSVAAPLAGYTTLGCGGPAALLLEVDSGEGLAAVLAVAEDNAVPWFVLGRGSNLLVADSGWPGLVLKLSGSLKDLTINGSRIDCGAGATLARLAAAAAEAGLSGLEPLAQIPGTVGGGVAMNAGAYGAAIADLVATIEIALPSGTRTIAGDALDFSYRHCDLPAGAVVSRVTLALTAADPETVKGAMKDYRHQRGGSQPVGSRTCGSVFKNPPGGSAGELLDKAGCKGMRAGGAEISTVHANFIVNTGSAAAADVLQLMERCRLLVHERFGVVLEPEVRLLGDITLGPLP
ncbi:MAG: UDP-N-acetylmuramate dehydrogenase [Thermoleophilia bacterium]